jgi:Flp pilus assembly protein TadB
MGITRCFRARDLVVTAGAFVAIAVLWATGHQAWTAATSAPLIPVLLAAYNYERRRK